MKTLGLTGLICLLLAPVVSALPVINEFVFNHTGADTHEFAEIFGVPLTDYSALTIVEIEGDSVSAGLIDDFTFAAGTTDALGIWASAFGGGGTGSPENGTVTLLLVTGYFGTLGSDIDTNNDGVLDTPYWTSIVDSVGVYDGGAADHNYSPTVLDNTLAPAGFTPGGASRLPDGTATWLRNDFSGEGFGPPFVGTKDPGEAANTPGALNAVVPEPASLALLGLGALVGLRRQRR